MKPNDSRRRIKRPVCTTSMVDAKLIQHVLFGVDPGNCFFPADPRIPGTGELGVPKGDEILEPILELFGALKHASDFGEWHSGLSRDRHPRETVHFREFGGKWPVHGVDGTPGCEFHPRIGEIVDGSAIFKKGFSNSDDGYSATEAVSEETGESLDDFYSTLGPRHQTVFYVWGLATDYCVMETVLGLLALGYRVVLLTDAIRAVNIKKGDDRRAIAAMVAAGVVCKTTKDIIGGWRLNA